MTNNIEEQICTLLLNLLIIHLPVSSWSGQRKSRTSTIPEFLMTVHQTVEFNFAKVPLYGSFQLFYSM